MTLAYWGTSQKFGSTQKLPIKVFQCSCQTDAIGWHIRICEPAVSNAFSVVLLLLGFLNTTDKNYCVHFWQMVLQPEILSHFFCTSLLQFGDTFLLIINWIQSGKRCVKYGEHVYNWGKRLQWWSWKESPLFCVVQRCTYGSILPQSVGPFWGVMIHLPLPLRIIHWYKGFGFRWWSLKYFVFWQWFEEQCKDAVAVANTAQYQQGCLPICCGQ